MPKDTAIDWAIGLRDPIRKLIAAGANDDDLRRLIEAKMAGDYAAYSRIAGLGLNRSGSHHLPADRISELADEICVAALKPVVNELTASQLLHYFQYVRCLASEIVAKHERAEFWSANCATGVVADVIMRAVLRRILDNGEPGTTSGAVAKLLDVRVVDGLGEVLSKAEFLKRRNWTDRDLRRSLVTRSVFFIEIEGESLFPSYLADNAYDRRQLGSVARALGELPGGSKHMFFTTPKGSLAGRTPLLALLRGELFNVKNAARAFAER